MTDRQVNENYIKVGCHTFPISNIQALYAEMKEDNINETNYI